MGGSPSKKEQPLPVQPEKPLPVQPEKDENNCSICQQLPKDWRKLVCNHQFCKNCIETWFKKNRTCPLCRRIEQESSATELTKIVGFNGRLQLSCGCKCKVQNLQEKCACNKRILLGNYGLIYSNGQSSQCIGYQSNQNSIYGIFKNGNNIIKLLDGIQPNGRDYIGGDPWISSDDW